MLGLLKVSEEMVTPLVEILFALVPCSLLSKVVFPTPLRLIEINKLQNGLGLADIKMAQLYCGTPSRTGKESCA